MTKNLISDYDNLGFDHITMQDALNKIKIDIEYAITTLGEKGKNALIRSQRPIILLHNAVKTSFIDLGVHPSLINPDLNHLKRVVNPPPRKRKRIITLPDKELSLAGYLKTKRQDVSIVPDNVPVSAETIQSTTLLNNYNDPYGSVFTESVLSVNIRSQLSSIAKNFDTLYERTFAEALNFHLRSTKMVLGEVYLIIVKPYCSDHAARNEISFKSSSYLEKYILAFSALNSRTQIGDPDYKYERIALLIVDFCEDTPKLYNTTQELINDNLLPEDSLAKLEGLSYVNFAEDLLEIYQARFPNNMFS